MFKPLKQYLTTSTGLSRSDSKAQRDFWSFLKILSIWGDVVGPLVYEHTRPKKIDGKTLIITVNHPAFSHELKNLQEKIISEIVLRIPYWSGKLGQLKFIFGQLEQDHVDLMPNSEAHNHRSIDHSKFKTQQKIREASYQDLEDEFKHLLASLHAQIDLEK